MRRHLNRVMTKIHTKDFIGPRTTVTGKSVFPKNSGVPIARYYPRIKDILHDLSIELGKPLVVRRDGRTGLDIRSREGKKLFIFKSKYDRGGFYGVSMIPVHDLTECDRKELSYYSHKIEKLFKGTH